MAIFIPDLNQTKFMLLVALLFIAFSAGTGFTVAYAILAKRLPTPKVPVFMHGVMASVGLTLFIIYAFNNADNFPKASLYFFLITAVLGLYLFRNDLWKRKPGPALIVVLHALCAVIAIALLILFIFY